MSEDAPHLGLAEPAGGNDQKFDNGERLLARSDIGSTTEARLSRPADRWVLRVAPMQGMHGFVQTPCVKCGTTVWISPAAGVGYCPSCQTPNQIPAGAGAQAGGVPGGAPAGSPQAAFQAAAMGGGGFPVGKVIGIVAGAIALTVGSIGFYFVKSALFGSGGKGHIGYAQMGIDPKKADPDKLITSVSGLAQKWKKDATWWSINLQTVGADGNADCSGGGCVVQYASLKSASSAATSVNKDSIKDFSFGPKEVNFAGTRGTAGGKPWKEPKAPPTPGCGIKQLVETQLKAKGLTGSKTVRVTFDASSGFGPSEWSWRVVGQDPKIDSYFSLATCAQTK
jgi:hypothetical protein